MPNTYIVVDSSFSKPHVRQHIIADNKQKDNRERERQELTAMQQLSFPSPPEISKGREHTILQVGLALESDEVTNTGMQDKSSTRLNRRSNNSSHTANAAKYTERNGNILQRQVEAESIHAGNIEIVTHGTIQTNPYQTFYNHRPLSLCLDQRYFPDQKYFTRHEYITEEGDFPDLNKLFPKHIIAPEPLPLDEPSDPDLFDKLREDVRHAKDPNYRKLVTVTAFWEDIRAQLSEDYLSSGKTAAFEGDAGVGLGTIFPSEAIVEPKNLRIELKKASGSPAQAFGNPKYLQVVRDQLMKRNRRKILEMSGNGHPRRAQTLTPLSKSIGGSGRARD